MYKIEHAMTPWGTRMYPNDFGGLTAGIERGVVKEEGYGTRGEAQGVIDGPMMGIQRQRREAVLRGQKADGGGFDDKLPGDPWEADPRAYVVVWRGEGADPSGEEMVTGKKDFEAIRRAAYGEVKG